MSTYRKEWPCCGDVTETQAWEPQECPFCAPVATSHQPAPIPANGDSNFYARTNAEYAAWCAKYYRDEALDGRGMASLHGLWAWQEQERRKMVVMQVARQEAAK